MYLILNLIVFYKSENVFTFLDKLFLKDDIFADKILLRMWINIIKRIYHITNCKAVNISIAK